MIELIMIIDPGEDNAAVLEAQEGLKEILKDFIE